MGIFDNLFTKTSSQQANIGNYSPITDYEAWVAILYACASADGETSEAEIDMISRLLVYKQKFVGIDIVPLYKNAMIGRNEFGNQKLIDGSASIIRQEDKATVFAMACEVVLADGMIGEQEKSLLEYISKELNLEEDIAAKIIEVLLIKNKGNRIITE